MTLRLWLLLSLILTIAACGGPNFMDKTKIDGSVLRGTAVKPGDQVFGRTVYFAKNFSLDPSNPSTFRKFGLCSGVVIHERYILTAAHCTPNIEESRVIFTENANKPITMDQVYQIKDFRIPRAYIESSQDEKSRNIPPGPDNRTHRYDIAVLQLDRPIRNAKFSDTYFTEIDSATYLSRSSKPLKAEAYVAGYGRISEYVRIQDDPRFRKEILLKGELPPLSGTLMKAKLTLSLEELSQRTFLRGQRFSPGVCAGDSGAPVFTTRGNKLYLQAIAIAAFKVKVEDPENQYNQCYGESIYLNLDFIKPWISESIRTMDKKFPKVERI